ncbi:MAG: Holliday junction resolvase RuvX, partial [Bacillota bacterium]
MRILGLDVGEKTIGIALSDPLGWTAQGLETLQRKGTDTDIAYLLQIIKKYEVEEIVVGLPLNMNG